MKLQAAFIFLVDDADEKTRAVVSTPSIDLQVIGCKNYAEAIMATKRCVDSGVTGIELCAGFGNVGIAQIQQAAGDDVAVGAVKFDLHPAFGFKSGDSCFL